MGTDNETTGGMIERMVAYSAQRMDATAILNKILPELEENARAYGFKPQGFAFIFLTDRGAIPFWTMPKGATPEAASMEVRRAVKAVSSGMDKNEAKRCGKEENGIDALVNEGLNDLAVLLGHCEEEIEALVFACKVKGTEGAFVYRRQADGTSRAVIARLLREAIEDLAIKGYDNTSDEEDNDGDGSRGAGDSADGI